MENSFIPVCQWGINIIKSLIKSSHKIETEWTFLNSFMRPYLSWYLSNKNKQREKQLETIFPYEHRSKNYQ